jgi:hypothetical protein
MTTTTENQTTKPKRIPDFYIFEDVPFAQANGQPTGVVFKHKKGEGFTILAGGRRYSAFPPKAKPAQQPEATEGGGA